MIRKLTSQQKEAIDYSKNMVITACPGSGKTTVIEEKVRDIVGNLEKHQGIIAITFTKKASQELRNRCKYNGHDTRQSFFGTIDKFCLEELIYPFLPHLWHKYKDGYEVIDNLDTKYLDFFLDKKVPKLFDITLDNGFQKLYENGILWIASFAGLSNFILDNSESAIRYLKSKYTHIFIDEYQDSSKEQHELFIRLVDLGLIGIAVGDADQSIYAFRGSSVQFLSDLISDTKKFKNFNIDLNHRCHTSISNYASKLKDPLFEIANDENIESRVYRFIIEGDHQEIAKSISEVINRIVLKMNVDYSDIAILAKSNKILEQVSEGLTVRHRLYIDTDIEKINTPVAHLVSDLLNFYYGGIDTVQEVVDRNSIKKIICEKSEFVILRNKIKSIRLIDESELIKVFVEIISKLGFEDYIEEINILIKIIENERSKKIFKPIDCSEVQLMTLHKSKGLEFHTVIHVGLEEWIFPYREFTSDWNSPSYPDLVQDTNLHYVGITRAKELCILIQSTKRINSNNEVKNATPSYFLSLRQLEGLYKRV